MSDKENISLNSESLKLWQDNDLEHLRYEYDLKVQDTVIDLGAYKGEWAQRIYDVHHCSIIAVEPTEYILDFKDGEVINRAAGTHAGKMSFGGRSYYTSAFEKGDHEYNCFDVAELILKYPEIALLKVNIEGAEYDVMSRIVDLGLQKRIKNIQVQFHQIEGLPYELWYKELAKKLSATHSLTWQYPYCWENWERK